MNVYQLCHYPYCTLGGVLSEVGTTLLDSVVVQVGWNTKVKKTEVLVVNAIFQPRIIDGIDKF